MCFILLTVSANNTVSPIIPAAQSTDTSAARYNSAVGKIREPIEDLTDSRTASPDCEELGDQEEDIVSESGYISSSTPTVSKEHWIPIKSAEELRRTQAASKLNIALFTYS